MSSEATRAISPASRVAIARGLRDFGDGFATVLLPVYLAALGLSAIEIGIVATLALLGSALGTILIGAIGHRFGDRKLLLVASLLMVGTGIGFALAGGYGPVLAIAFLGTLNPQAGNASVFVPLEHALLSRSVSDASRTAAFARYGLVGALAAAMGSLAAASPELMQGFGVSQLTALKAMFVLYGLLGLAGGIIYWGIPRGEAPAPGAKPGALGPSKGIVVRLAALFSIDAFAGGFVVQALLALYLFERFGMSLSSAGLFFFWSGILAAVSQPVAAWLAKRIGLVNTMVYTHIPSNVFLILAAIVPSLPLALAFLLARAFLSQMDIPARSSYVMAVVTPPERTAAASFTAVPRSLAAAASPAISGAFIAAGMLAWPLVIGGLLKIIYDLLLLWMFHNVKPPEEQKVPAAAT